MCTRDLVYTQVAVAWWLVACVVITAAYRSSLAAHLTVRSRARPIDSFEDLVSRKDWVWGADRIMYTSSTWTFFNSTDPLMVKVQRTLQVKSLWCLGAC